MSFVSQEETGIWEGRAGRTEGKVRPEERKLGSGVQSTGNVTQV